MRHTCIAIALCAGSLPASTAFAGIVYDGRAGWTGSNAFVTSGTEWADDVHLTNAGTLTSFSVDYTQSTASSLTVRFYTNDATNTTYPGPATLLATYSGIAVSGGGASGTATYNVPVVAQIALPEHVWMSVAFNGQVLLRLQGGTVVGSSDIHRTTVPGNGAYNFDWPGNFPFTVSADVVPTPGASALLAVAGIACIRRRR